MPPDFLPIDPDPIDPVPVDSSPISFAPIAHTQESSRHTFQVQSQDKEAHLVLIANEAIAGKLLALISLQCDGEYAHKLLLHLAGYLHQHPILGKLEWMIQISPRVEAFHAAMIEAGWQRSTVKLLYRKTLDQIPSAGAEELELRMVPATEMAPHAFADLFHACNLGNPDEPHLHLESPQGYLRRWTTELADLHVPELAYAVTQYSQAIGVILFRISRTPTHVIGFINFIGIHPTHRNRGLGTLLHRIAIRHLSTLGCTHYIGSTPEANHPMRQVFHHNAVPEFGKQVFLRATAHCPH